MLDSISINSAEWTAVPVSEYFYKNNSNNRIYLQEMDTEEVPEDADGMIILPYESFKITGEKFYYAKTLIGTSDIIIDLFIIVPEQTEAPAEPPAL